MKTVLRGSSDWDFDRSGRLLELVVLRFDSGNELVIHSMKARTQYYDLLT